MREKKWWPVEQRNNTGIFSSFPPFGGWWPFRQYTAAAGVK
jgi:hypothetical protein